ncbi:hypothetical protein JIN85_14665 [Luteolibacter pohnpeiensis]|uniref:Uncharacterized protein n=1 Tax=Luteolibacter pohnpeiensis TaxID=454153 RepID=A0A934S6Q8_9BACT|nr:hypothetical protein [Luteolibacter pohnpeiensis]MBK1883661.1 hypothetical protein [Luteolibacter pohnpeiensis]
MSALSDYLENKLADHILGGSDYTRPATVYLALYTAGPTDAGGGTEVSGNGYARASVTNNNTNFPGASAGLKANGAAITFSAATGAWGSITHFAIFDSSSGGNMLIHGALTTSKVVETGDVPSFPIGSISLQFN